MKYKYIFNTKYSTIKCQFNSSFQRCYLIFQQYKDYFIIFAIFMLFTVYNYIKFPINLYFAKESQIEFVLLYNVGNIRSFESSTVYR